MERRQHPSPQQLRPYEGYEKEEHKRMAFCLSQAPLELLSLRKYSGTALPKYCKQIQQPTGPDIPCQTAWTQCDHHPHWPYWGVYQKQQGFPKPCVSHSEHLSSSPSVFPTSTAITLAKMVVQTKQIRWAISWAFPPGKRTRLNYSNWTGKLQVY